ncbi:MAG: hotdog fold thioesterase [Spirochaetes bacterium]|nr:hotdog fold thioesterase [Spirochaetota bacterium]
MMRRINNPFVGHEGYECFGCAPHNPVGLKLEFYEDGADVVASVEPADHFQGYDRVLHGGIQATLIDEVSSWVVFVKIATAGVTQKMEISYDKPAFVGRPVTVRARLLRMEKNIAVIEAALYQSGNEPCARATCRYYTYPEKIARRKLMYPGIENFLPDDAPEDPPDEKSDETEKN